MLTVPDGSIKDQEENETKLCIEEDEKDNKGFQLTHENRSQEGEDFIGHLLKVYPNEKLWWKELNDFIIQEQAVWRGWRRLKSKT